MVTWHLTMKLFPAKCHDRATLRKLWRQTGNSSLLPTKCWPLLQDIARISAQFSNFAFVLFCYITNHLMTGPLGNSEFCFPRTSLFPSTSSRETLTFSGNKIHCSPWDHSLSVQYIPHKWIVLFAHADWLARRWLATYYSPPSSLRKTKWYGFPFRFGFRRENSFSERGGCTKKH